MQNGVTGMTAVRHFRPLAIAALAAMAATAASITACAPAFRGYGGAGVGLHVANYSLDSIALTVEVDGVRSKLGTVARNDYRFFELQPAASAATARVVIHAGAGPGTSLHVDTLRVRRGGVIDLRVESPLRRSIVRHY
jgi:hypothetical protein